MGENDRKISLEGGTITIESLGRVSSKRKPFSSNYVKTSNYTWWNFLPKNLFEQLSTPTNFYFLFIGILQMIKAVSTTAGMPTMYQALGFVILVSAVRALVEDISRHRADARRNSTLYEVVREKDAQSVKLGALKVGQIIKIKKDQLVPADIVLLRTSYSSGHCFIDKSNLNGETTLEVVTSLLQTQTFFENRTFLQDFKATITYESPNSSFETFRGSLLLQNQEIILNKPLILRECILRNVDYVYGLIVYTGYDTKLLKSSKLVKKVVKRSRIMSIVNFGLAGLFFLQILLCLSFGISSGFFQIQANSWWYLADQGTDAVVTGVLSFWTWFILLYQLVPITLVVSSEMVKFGLSAFVRWDLVLYDTRTKRKPRVNTITIPEDLGMVDYIFSDKTGTITQNKMEFRFMLLAGGQFGSKVTEIAKAVVRRQEEIYRKNQHQELKMEPATLWSNVVRPLLPPPIPDEVDCCLRCCGGYCACCWSSPRKNKKRAANVSQTSNEFSAAEKAELLHAMWASSGKLASDIHTFVRHMALSNTVQPYADPKTKALNFQAESAEEKAMVEFARFVGFTKKSIHPTILEIVNDKGKVVEEKYEHLAIFGFSSIRARVTVIYRSAQTKKVLVMMKGADSTVIPLIRFPSPQDEETLLLDLAGMATNGLRTLVLAHAELPSSFWSADLDKRYTLLMNRPAPKDDHELQRNKAECHDFFNFVEKSAEMQYLGCMGLEDQLQPLVPESIADFIKAGIKVWMITGDKLETAKNIGLACNLIDPDMMAQLDHSMPADDMAGALENSRLIEITGQWASLANDEEQLRNLFSMFKNRRNTVGFEELDVALRALKCSVPTDRLKKLLQDIDGNTAKMDTSEFLSIMKAAQVTPYDAVLHDIMQGVQVFHELGQDIRKYPISLLINDVAFEALYPEMSSDEQITAERKAQLEVLRDHFFTLASVSKTVVFARARPAMKKKMVTEIMARLKNVVTLAIGDGANDVEMIKAAHVGVGIAGLEGTAASLSADYAIGSFRMLHTLLFVHGFWGYQRVSILVLFIFYKCALLAISTYFFGIDSLFSGQQFFEDSILNLYNVIYTALPGPCFPLLRSDLAGFRWCSWSFCACLFVAYRVPIAVKLKS